MSCLLHIWCLPCFPSTLGKGSESKGCFFLLFLSFLSDSQVQLCSNIYMRFHFPLSDCQLNEYFAAAKNQTHKLVVLLEHSWDEHVVMMTFLNVSQARNPPSHLWELSLRAVIRMPFVASGI